MLQRRTINFPLGPGQFCPYKDWSMSYGPDTLGLNHTSATDCAGLDGPLTSASVTVSVETPGKA